MVIPNEVSVDLTQQKIDNVMAAVEAIYTELPFLIGLTPIERMRMNKAGDASQAFIRKCAYGSHRTSSRSCGARAEGTDRSFSVSHATSQPLVQMGVY